MQCNCTVVSYATSFLLGCSRRTTPYSEIQEEGAKCKLRNLVVLELSSGCWRCGPGSWCPLSLSAFWPLPSQPVQEYRLLHRHLAHPECLSIRLPARPLPRLPPAHLCGRWCP